MIVSDYIRFLDFLYLVWSENIVFCDYNQGPSMGELYCPDSNNWIYNNTGNFYPNIGIPANFTIEDYEVFQIIKPQDMIL